MRNPFEKPPIHLLMIEKEGDEPAGGAAPVDRGDDIPDDDDAPEPEKKTDDEQTSDELAAELETDEEKAEREEEEAKAAAETEKARKQRIPVGRHKEILEQQRAEALNRERALAARVAELESKQPTPASSQQADPLIEFGKSIRAKQDEYEELLFAGEKEEARALRKEIDAMQEQYSDAKIARTSTATHQATIDSLKYEQALARHEAAYPALNPDGDAFDEARATEVAELMGMFQNQGFNRTASLDRAVKYVLGAPLDSSKPADGVAKALSDKLSQDARKRAADSSKRQPPNSQMAGKDNDKSGAPVTGVDIMRLNQKQFAKLDADTVSKMRGDEV